MCAPVGVKRGGETKHVQRAARVRVLGSGYRVRV